MDRYTVTRKGMGSLKSISNGRKRVRLMIPQIDQSCFSCSAVQVLVLDRILLAQPLGPLKRNNGGVCFWESWNHDGGADTSEYHHDPKDPSPRSVTLYNADK